MAVRLRRFLKRAVKPVVMVGLVGTLSVSLVVSTPSNAQAFVPPVLPVIAGATTLAMPSVLATSLALHPVGWGILGLTALGVGLYASKDYWLPYVTGEFGQGGAEPVPSGDYGSEAGYTIDSFTVTGNTIAANYLYAGRDVSNGWTQQMDAIGQCRDASGADKYQVRSVTRTLYDSSAFEYGYVFNMCEGMSLVGAKIGGGGGAAMSGSWQPNITGSANPVTFQGSNPSSEANGWHGTTNIESWGTMASQGGSFDPRGADLSYRVEAECIASDGTIATATADSLGSEGGIKFPSCEAAGLGHGTGAVKVFTAAPGFAPDEVLWETKRPAEDPAQPLCSPTRPTSGCKLGVSLDGMPCVVGSVECENWAELRNDPNYSTRLSCQYGPYQVSMETCNPLERAYEPGGAPATEPNTDGNPATRSDTMPNGQTQPKIEPGTGTGSAPIPGGAAAGPVPGSTTQQAECFPTGWAMLNPIEWVMKPVGCALDAAFKPKKDLQARLTGMQGQFSNKVPVSWFGVGVQGAAGGACPVDWAVTFDGHRYSLICGTEADNIIRGFRPVLGSMLIMAMLWPFIRSLFYAAIPVFKVTPS